jgi:hypothetical protein
MSLTSYRAAPPRVVLCVVFVVFVVLYFDRLEDLAATYSPVP